MASLTSPASLARLVRPIHGEDELDQLLDLVAQARIVVLGGSSYGSHEHYDLRASLTRKLIRDRGFAAVAIEADWPDAMRVDRYVRNQSDDDSADVALAAFDHFPAWAWRNHDVAQFVEWLRYQNLCCRHGARAGFYGLDVYSMNASVRAMRTHVDVCDSELIAELVDMQWRHAARSGRAPSGEAWLHAMPDAHGLAKARAYYRTLFAGGDEAWNLHSTHMADTIDLLAAQLGSKDDPAKLVVWAHNTHVGDARALAYSGPRIGRTSLGTCLRQRHTDDVALVGFTTYEGSVLCAPGWDAHASAVPLEPGHANSWEALFHGLGIPRFMVTASALRRATSDLTRLHRNIGAVMRSDPYFEVRLADHYDVVVHVDVTRAVPPLLELAPMSARVPGDLARSLLDEP